MGLSMSITKVLELGLDPSEVGAGPAVVFFFRISVAPRKWSPNVTDRCFLGMDSHRINRAELASFFPLGATWEKKTDYLLNLCLSTSLLSGHQEFGEVKTNCPLSHPPKLSSSNLRGGDKGTE